MMTINENSQINSGKFYQLIVDLNNKITKQKLEIYNIDDTVYEPIIKNESSPDYCKSATIMIDLKFDNLPKRKISNHFKEKLKRRNILRI
jgi:hypothetical protein